MTPCKPPDHTTCLQIVGCSMRSWEPSIFFVFWWWGWVWHSENDRAGSRTSRSCLRSRVWPSDGGTTNLKLSSFFPLNFFYFIKCKEHKWTEIFCELVLVTAHNFPRRKNLELLNSCKTPFSCFKMKYIDIFL